MDGRTKKIIPHALGYLACLYGSYCTGAVLCEGKCKLYFQKDGGKQDLTVDGLLRVWCSKCDTDVPGNELNSKILHLPNVQDIGFAEDYGYNHLQSLFFKLLYDESSEDIQVSCVDVIQRILLHVTESILLTTRCEWLKCIDYLLLHRIKVVREAFCAKVGFFLEEPILNCLFLDGEPNKTKEQKFMEKLKDALSATDDPLVHETLLEAAVNVMNTVDVHSQFFFFSLILLIDQLDNPHLQVRIIASRLIRGSCYFHTEDGYELLPKVLCIRNELYDYLSSRLASSPKIVEEFALAVLDIETEKLVKKMVPVVLPKLIVTQKGGDEVITILHELAKCLNTDMVQLIVNWLPKVLAYALHRAERQDLLSVLQFYHEKTGSDNQEIFSAALPALLDELVCFTDEDVKEINKRYNYSLPSPSKNSLSLHQYKRSLVEGATALCWFLFEFLYLGFQNMSFS